jgi:ABC-type multidrug transport system fused ATPase/permease subunit
MFGLINLLVVLAIFQVYGKLFRNQIEAQRGFVVARNNKAPIPNVVRIGTRIKSGETGILFSSIAMLILLAMLIYLSYIGEISKSNTIVLFFGLRMQNSNFSNISTALMRFARARTHSE